MNALARRARYLEAMQVQAWVPRAAAESCAPGDEVRREAPEHTPPAATRGAVEDMSLTALETAVAGCHLCPLAEGRTNTVFGVGDPHAACMIIGEAPGAEEDARGEPFVGRAGRLLNTMLQAMGFAREAVYIANIVKCRPPKNRDPKPEEMVACTPYLRRQITLIEPRVILAVGRVAAQNLTASTVSIGRMRGQSHVYENSENGARIPIVVTYHPAYLLRSPLEKRKSWEDLRRVRELLEAD